MTTTTEHIEAKERNHSRLVTAQVSPSTARVFDRFAMFLLASFSALIFWRVPGVTQYDSDDYWVTFKLTKLILPHDLESYIAFIGGRNFNLYYLQNMFELGKHNTDALTLCGIALFAASTAALYFCLKRTLSAPAALVGAALFLAHGVKWHPILTWNAQGYIPVVFTAVLIFAVLTSRTKRGVQCAILAPIYWASLHMYEILLLLVPLFPLFWLGPSIAKKRMPAWQDLAYSCIPIAITAAHVFMLSRAPKPLWHRNLAMDPDYFSKIPQHVVQLFANGVSQIAGKEHFGNLIISLRNFFRYDVKTDHSLWFAFALCIASVIISCTLARKPAVANLAQSTSTNHQPFFRWALLLSGLFLAAIGPLLALPCTLEWVPSRLLFLPSLGFAIFVATALELFARPRIYKVSIAIALIACLIEAIAFANITQQMITASDLDKRISSGLKAIEQLHLRPGDQIFISLPHQERRHTYWRIEPPAFYHSPYPSRLWAAYNIGIKGVKYSSVMRFPGMQEPWGLNTWVQGSLQLATAERLYPFYMTDEGEIIPITTVNMTDLSGRFEKAVPMALNTVLPASRRYVLSAKQDQFTQPWCWNMNCPVPATLPNPTQDH